MINVAISRAQARVFVIASEENLKNKCLHRIAGVIEGYEDAKEARPIGEFLDRLDFPACVVGKTVALVKSTGEQLICEDQGD